MVGRERIPATAPTVRGVANQQVEVGMEQDTEDAAVRVTPEPVVWPRVMESTDATLVTLQDGRASIGPVTVVHPPGATPPAVVPTAAAQTAAGHDVHGPRVPG